MPKRKKYTAEFKTRVVLELLTAQKGLMQASPDYAIKDTILNRWKQEFLGRAPQFFSGEQVDDHEADLRIAELERVVGKLTLDLEIDKVNMVNDSRKKAAFIKTGEFSYINRNILEILKRQLPEYHFDVIDVWDEYLRLDFLSVFYAFKEYGSDILLGRKNINDCRFATPPSFRRIKKYLIGRLEKCNYSFTFQTQSLFDASLPGVPHFIYTDHTHLANLNYPTFSWRDLFSEAWIELEKTIYQAATLNFTMSTNISRSIIEKYSCDPQKVVCVYVGSNIKPIDGRELNSDRFFKKNILFVGIDWIRKGGPELEQAFRIVLKAFPDAQLTIVGCSPKITTPNCNVIGKVSLEDVGRYFQSASVFCLPSKREPFGIAFIEALAYRLPVIAPNVGAIPDLVIDGESGYLVEPNDVCLLSNKLLELLANPVKCKEFGEKGYRLGVDRYSWEGTGKRILENIRQYI